jgi:hypothetical protein
MGLLCWLGFHAPVDGDQMGSATNGLWMGFSDGPGLWFLCKKCGRWYNRLGPVIEAAKEATQ